MDEMKLFSVIIVSYLRYKDLKECLGSIVNHLAAPEHSEIIVIDNAGTDECRNICEQFPVKYINAGTNLGVSGGRNLGIKMSKGDLLFFIDDDAEAATLYFDRLIRDRLKPPAGILAFKVLNYQTGKPNPGELPFRGKNYKAINSSRLVSYFVGAAFALDRSLADEIGGFAEDFFYGAEELEFSYRTLLHDWKIYYTPEITVLHKKSMIRTTNKTRYYHTLKNRFVAGARYLPFPYCLVNLSLWSLVMLFQSIGDRAFKEWAAGLIKGLSAFSRERRHARPLDRKTMDYLRAHEGRLWF
ncbi:MAG: glycosyltransferase [Syntrophomonadaceae bacterium]|nr:glycosyltransferase [Syntrophomonadaceae bacterium]